MSNVGQEGYDADRESDAVERVAKADELERLQRQKSRVHRRIVLWQFAAYVLIVTISIVGWWQIEKEAEARCEAGEIHREGLRNIVFAIEKLGTDLVTGGVTGEATPEQKATLAQFAQFREEQIALLEGPVCPDGE